MRAISLLALAACTADPAIPNVARSTCPRPQLFEHAVCSCGDFGSVGDLHVRKGPAGLGSIGVNGATDLVASADVAGTWFAWGGFRSVGGTIGDSLVTPGDVDLVGDATIAGDLTVGGDLHAVGSLAVLGSLAVRGDVDVVGDQAIARRAAYVAPEAPPCGCNDQRFFDVAGAVALAKEKLGGGGEWVHTGTSELRLAEGSYYVTAAELVGDTTIIADGNVSIFVEGNLDAVGSARWRVAPGGQLDLFVSGNVGFVGDVTAEAFRLFVGGDAVTTVGTAVFHGALYAPRADVEYVGDATVVGSIFSRTIQGVGELTVEYGAPLAPPSSCRLEAPGIAATPAVRRGE